ncbi:MAG: ShlB/FhaC/HecB family hemolysin secretion/activation protein [Pseudanabaenaceae cyanobacterium]|jgi:hemolysin activation/secretion protein
MAQSKVLAPKGLIWAVLFGSSCVAVSPSYSQTSAISPETTVPSATASNLTSNVTTPVLAPVVNSPAQPVFNGETQPEFTIAQAAPIKQVELVGNTVLSPEEIAQILAPLQGNPTPNQIQDAAEAITQLYVANGYVTSRAVFNPSNVVNGVAKIQAVEGSLEKTEVRGNVQTNPDYIRSRVELGSAKPFNANRMEDQLRLLRNDPLFRNVTSSLKPGSSEGKSLLVVTVEEANQFSGSVSFDNYSPVAVGSERMGLGLSYRNLTGLGDVLSASYYRSTTGGSNLYDFNYTIPVSPMNGTVSIRYAPSDYRITDPAFSALNIRGTSSLYDIVYRQPLTRTPREEFALSLGFAYQTGQTFLFENLAIPFGIGPDANGVSTTSVFRFAQDYTLRDPQGIWSARSQFNLGTGLFGATYVTVPNAGFFSWAGQLQRLELLSPDVTFIGSLDTQLSANPLLPSQQFVVGGGQSVRGFRQNARSGDNGIRLNLETRFTAMRDKATNRSILQIAPFIDLGGVWNHGNNPTPSLSQNFLAGGGLGIIIEPIERLVLRIDGAIPFVNLQGRGNNLQDTAVYFSASYQF